MLLQFTFKNFRSFKDEVSLDMTAADLKEKENHVVQCGNINALKGSVIVGANASGKSNVCSALKCMHEYIRNSLLYGDEAERSPANLAPFLFNHQSRKEPVSFEVVFFDSETCKVYQYGFSVRRGIVEEEWLFSRGKTCREFTASFERKGLDIDFDSNSISPVQLNGLQTMLNPEVLALSLGSKLRIPVLSTVYKWFLKNRFLDFSKFEDYSLDDLLPAGFKESETIRNELVRFISKFDESILEFRYPEGIAGPAELIESVHKFEDSDELTSIPLYLESKGILKMISLYEPLMKTLKSGGFFCIDELNSSLHPLLERYILQIFMNEETNPNHAQLIFTSHNTWLLSCGALRKDEIWFTEKDQNGVSDLFTLTDFRNEDEREALFRNYLLGKYGAIPELKEFAFPGTDHKNV